MHNNCRCNHYIDHASSLYPESVHNYKDSVASDIEDSLYVAISLADAYRKK